MPPRPKSDQPTPHESLTFESALTALEQIVASMESDTLPLEDLVAKYQAGTKLLKHCDQVLSSAKQRITLITLSTTTSPPKPQPSEDETDHNDSRLF